MHLADAFIQSDLQCIQAIHLFYYQYACSLVSEPTTFCAANVMLNHSDIYCHFHICTCFTLICMHVWCFSIHYFLFKQELSLKPGNTYST